MKKWILSSLMLMALTTMAQTEKKSWLVGGGLSLRTGSSTAAFSITPSAGMFIADNFVVGGNIEYDYNKIGDLKSNGFGIGPFTRYYFGKSKTKPFAVGEFAFETNTTKNSVTNTNIKTNGYGFLFGLGFAAFINKNIAIEGISGYSFSKFKDTDGSGGFNLRLGFGLYFNRNNVKDLKNNILEN
jgi:hypothetical protein